MRMRLLVLIGALGCGGVEMEPGETECFADGYHFRVDFDSDCALWARNAARARALLSTVATGEELERYFFGLRVDIRGGSDIGCTERVLGVCTRWRHGVTHRNGVELNCRGDALLHESLHWLDRFRSGKELRDIDHSAWPFNGWQALDARYRLEAESGC